MVLAPAALYRHYSVPGWRRSHRSAAGLHKALLTICPNWSWARSECSVAKHALRPTLSALLHSKSQQKMSFHLLKTIKHRGEKHPAMIDLSSYLLHPFDSASAGWPSHIVTCAASDSAFNKLDKKRSRRRPDHEPGSEQRLALRRMP